MQNEHTLYPVDKIRVDFLPLSADTHPTKLSATQNTQNVSINQSQVHKITVDLCFL